MLYAGMMFLPLTGGYLYSQGASSHRLWSTYSYNHVLVNNQRLPNAFKTTIRQAIRFKTIGLSFHEFQVDNEIALVMKAGTDVLLSLDRGTLIMDVFSGVSLVKVLKPRRPFVLRIGSKLLYTNESGYKLIRRPGLTQLQVRSGKVTVILRPGITTTINAGQKLTILGDRLGKPEPISDTEKVCLDDLRDVQIMSEEEILKLQSSGG